MDKENFLRMLQNALVGAVGPEVVNENMSYYENYINTQIRMGKSEEEVFAQLGDPRLIAKSIISANLGGDRNVEYNSEPTVAQDSDLMPARRIPKWVVAIVLLLIVVVLGYFVIQLLPLLVIGGAIWYGAKKLKEKE